MLLHVNKLSQWILSKCVKKQTVGFGLFDMTGLHRENSGKTLCNSVVKQTRQMANYCMFGFISPETQYRQTLLQQGCAVNWLLLSCKALN